jgi:hypothetical protein
VPGVGGEEEGGGGCGGGGSGSSSSSGGGSLAYEEYPRVGWDEGRSLGIEFDSRYRKYKESVCLTNLISQPSFSYLSSSYQQQSWQLIGEVSMI